MLGSRRKSIWLKSLAGDLLLGDVRRGPPNSSVIATRKQQVSSPRKNRNPQTPAEGWRGQLEQVMEL